MKSSKILIRAKDFLWDGTRVCSADACRFICNAIQRTRSGDEGNYLMREIHEKMGNCMTVEDWLMKKSLIAKDPLFWNRAQIQAYRLRWLNHLIEEYQAKGD